MTKEQKLEMFSMKLDGFTLREIADKFEVSYEAVRLVLPEGLERGSCRKSKSVYVNLENWMKENNVRSWKKFSEMAGLTTTQSFQIFVSGRQNNPNKKTIDKVLKVTGLTYEELFYKEES